MILQHLSEPKLVSPPHLNRCQENKEKEIHHIQLLLAKYSTTINISQKNLDKKQKFNTCIQFLIRHDYVCLTKLTTLNLISFRVTPIDFSPFFEVDGQTCSHLGSFKLTNQTRQTATLITKKTYRPQKKDYKCTTTELIFFSKVLLGQFCSGKKISK